MVLMIFNIIAKIMEKLKDLLGVLLVEGFLQRKVSYSKS